MKNTEKFNLISDLHKDARGYRPTANYFDWFDGLSADQAENEWNSLHDELVASQQERESIKQKNMRNFIARIKENRKLGARTIKDAIRWILDADNLKAEDYNSWDYGGYVCYSLNISYKYERLFSKFETRPQMQEVETKYNFERSYWT